VKSKKIQYPETSIQNQSIWAIVSVAMVSKGFDILFNIKVYTQSEALFLSRLIVGIRQAPATVNTTQARVDCPRPLQTAQFSAIYRIDPISFVFMKGFC
jgi:hypothetical protein